MEDRDIKQAVLDWVGIDSFVLRLLMMACELHNSMDEAHEVFCRLREEGYLQLKTAGDIPRGAAARYYRRVTAEELLLARIRLAPGLMVLDKRLAEFVLRDCISTLRQSQPSSEVFQTNGAAAILSELYRTLAQTIADCFGLDTELTDALQLACGELSESANRDACQTAIDGVCS